MPAQRKSIFERTNDEKWEQLFQKTTEAIRLFGERPDLLRGFVDALKTGEFFGERPPPNVPLELPRDEPRGLAGLGRPPQRPRKG
jgi:hypothetical protein